MWLAVSSTVALISLPVILIQCRKFDDFPTRCMLIAIWIRYVAQAFPEYTLYMSFAGFSIVALVSIAMTGLMVIAADFRLLRLRNLLSVYLLIFWVILSSLINGEYGGLVNNLVKWAYFVFLIIIAYRSIVIFGRSRVMYSICWAFFTPVMLMILSIALDHKKPWVENEQAIAYVGGYYHEAVISEILFSFICVASLVEWRRRGVGIALILLGIVLIFYANYRTTIIATMPILLFAAVSVGLAMISPKFRPAARALAIVLVILGGGALWNNLPDRYADVLNIASRAEILTESPSYFSKHDKDLLNGRVYLWSEYIQAYFDGQSAYRLIGFGANSYEGRMRLYAHNTFVSYLYEFGAIGLMLLIYFFLGNLATIFTLPDSSMLLRLGSLHAGYLIQNLATMPLWSIEGMTTYALILATTFTSLASAPAPARTPEVLRRSQRPGIG